MVSVKMKNLPSTSSDTFFSMKIINKISKTGIFMIPEML
jgi:hypothetical protein